MNWSPLSKAVKPLPPPRHPKRPLHLHLLASPHRHGHPNQPPSPTASPPEEGKKKEKPSQKLSALALPPIKAQPLCGDAAHKSCQSLRAPPKLGLTQTRVTDTTDTPTSYIQSNPVHWPLPHQPNPNIPEKKPSPEKLLSSLAPDPPTHPRPSLSFLLSLSLSLAPRSLQARRTKHQSVFSPSTLGPLSHLQVPLKAPTVAPASVHATPSPGTGTADKGPVWE